jgi:hypothetical protein
MANALTRLIADAKDSARHDLEEEESGSRSCRDWNGDKYRGRSFRIRTRAGNTITYYAERGPRGGVTIRRQVVVGWISDHPADWDPRASY